MTEIIVGLLVAILVVLVETRWEPHLVRDRKTGYLALEWNE